MTKDVIMQLNIMYFLFLATLPFFIKACIKQFKKDLKDLKKLYK